MTKLTANTLFLIFFFPVFGWAQGYPTSKDLVKKDSVYYYENTPFTGTVIDYNESGQKILELRYETGRQLQFSKRWDWADDWLYIQRTQIGDTLFNTFYWSENIKRQTYTTVNGKKNGYQRDFKRNGAIHAQFKFEDGRQHGKFIFWYSNGQIHQEGYMCGYRKENCILGYKEWYENGQLHKEEIYPDNSLGNKTISEWHQDGGKKRVKIYRDKKIVKDTSWYENGQMEELVEADDQGKTTKMRTWHSNGQLRMDRSYEKGRPHGPQKSWYSSGKSKGELSWNNGHIVRERKWHENGQKKLEEAWNNGQIQEWYESGKKMTEGSKKEGKKDGQWMEWYENGQMKSLATWKQDKLIDTYTQWFENGQKREEQVYKISNIPTEKCLYSSFSVTGWYENGQKSAEATYINCKLDGFARTWRETGQLWEEKQYEEGMANGEWKEWYKNGELKSNILYKWDRPVKR